MGNKVSCTSANKEDKADAKAEKKEKNNRPVEKKAEGEDVNTDTKATVEITRPEGEVSAQAPGKPEGASKPEDVKLEEKIQEKAEEQKEDAQKTLDVVVPKMESVVSSVPGMVQEVKAKGDDIREDIVQKVTIETKAVELTVTEFIDEDEDTETPFKREVLALNNQLQAKDTAASGVEKGKEIVQETIEKYDSPEDLAKAKENFLMRFRDENKLHSVDLMRVWKNYDKDQSGFLEKSELPNFLKDLLASKGQKTDKKTVADYGKIMMSTFDSNKDGKLELSELSRLLPVEKNFLAKFPGREKCSREDFNKIFAHFDKDGSGKIGHTELLALMKDLFQKEGPHNMNVPDISSYADGVFDIYDKSKDGALTREELGMVLSKS